MFVYGKVNRLDQSFYNFLTHFTTWWAGQVRYPYQNMQILEWKLSTTITENIVLHFKELTEQKPVTFRRYVFILKGNRYFITGTGQWHTHVC